MNQETNNQERKSRREKREKWANSTPADIKNGRDAIDWMAAKTGRRMSNGGNTFMSGILDCALWRIKLESDPNAKVLREDDITELFLSKAVFYEMEGE